MSKCLLRWLSWAVVLCAVSCDKPAPSLEPPPAQPAPLPTEAPDPARAEQTAREQKARAEAAEKRLDALRAKIKPLTADAFWESADAADQQQHYKEACTPYQGLALHHPRDPRALRAAQRAALTHFRLQD